MNNKSIGILGGMGPAATACLYDRIICLAQTEYQAIQDSDFPEMVLMSVPAQGFDHLGFQKPYALPQALLRQLTLAARRLEDCSVDFIISACNTISYYHQTLQAAIEVPFLNIVEETVKAAQVNQFSRIGVLASESSNNLKIYSDRLTMNDKDHIGITNLDQEILNNIIQKGMAGTQSTEDIVQINIMCDSLVSRGAQAVIIGCTDLSLLSPRLNTTVPIVDSLDVIARVALNKSYGKELV